MAVDGKPLPPELQDLLDRIASAERYAETAYWWFKGIDLKTAQEHNVADQIANVLSLLTKVDNISMDIVITVKQLPYDKKQNAPRRNLRRPRTLPRRNP